MSLHINPEEDLDVDLHILWHPPQIDPPHDIIFSVNLFLPG